MKQSVILLHDTSGELLPSDLVAHCQSDFEPFGVLWLCASATRREALRRAWFANWKGFPAIRVQFATFEQIGEHFATSRSSHSRTTLRALRRVLLDACIQSNLKSDEFQPFQKAIRSRGFLDSAWRTFDEWDGQSVSENGNLPAIRALIARYREILNKYGLIDPRLTDETAKADLTYSTIIIDDHRGTAQRWASILRGMNAASTLLIRTPDADSFWKERFPKGKLKKIKASKKKTKFGEHLRKELFQNSSKKSKKAEGLELIEAPGELGEARMVCRRIRELIAAGADAHRIVVTARRLDRSMALLLPTLREYQIPFEEDLTQIFARQPAIANLLAFLQIPQEGWQFRDISTLLRSNYFQPAWLEVVKPADFLRDAELFLRYLGESSGRKAFENGLDTWAVSPPAPLEDEDMEVRERARMQSIAIRCRPFFRRLFDLLDSMPQQVKFEHHLQALKVFADELGIARSLAEYPTELRIWQDFSAILEALPKTDFLQSRSGFLRTLGVVSRCDRARNTGLKSGVHIVAAEDAPGLDCDTLFIVGLGEGSFPSLNLAGNLLSDDDRRALIADGVPISNPDTILDRERELFRELVETPTQSLILSYPAVDSSGQPLLPSSFLRAVRNCFSDNAILVHRKSMVIEGVYRETAYSPAERRVRFSHEVARDWQDADWSWGGDTSRTIRQSGAMAEARFRRKIHNEYDGMAASVRIVELLKTKFGEQKIFSPTSLEVYVACPFRFMMQHVLSLQKLDEPTEEIEAWRKGMAFHRALSRLHEKLLKSAAQSPVDPASPEFRDNFERHLSTAIEEYSVASASPFTRQLWELEGDRLRRLTSNYGSQWAAFQDSWSDVGTPQPAMLETAFGFRDPNSGQINSLAIERSGERIQLGGRIDRIDTVQMPGEVGFWVIDYKTGTPSNYAPAKFQNMEKLQLTLYALAAQKLFFGDQAARPLGLAYWFVAHPDGLKTVYPKAKKTNKKMVPSDPQDWDLYRNRLEDWVFEIVKRIRAGLFPLAPRSEESCRSCPYLECCRISQSRGAKVVWILEPNLGTSE